MAKITVDVILNDGEDSTTFGDSFSSNDNVEVRNPMVSNPSLIGVNVEESYFDTFKSDSRIKTAQRADEFPIISKPGEIIEVPWETVEKQKKLASKIPLAGYIKDYYLSNSICRASKTMGNLARARSSLNLKKAS